MCVQCLIEYIIGHDKLFGGHRLQRLLAATQSVQAHRQQCQLQHEINHICVGCAVHSRRYYSRAIFIDISADFYVSSMQYGRLVWCIHPRYAVSVGKRKGNLIGYQDACSMLNKLDFVFRLPGRPIRSDWQHGRRVLDHQRSTIFD